VFAIDGENNRAVKTVTGPDFQRCIGGG
jgi:hypothetical protein